MLARKLSSVTSSRRPTTKLGQVRGQRMRYTLLGSMAVITNGAYLVRCRPPHPTMHPSYGAVAQYCGLYAECWSSGQPFQSIVGPLCYSCDFVNMPLITWLSVHTSWHSNLGLSGPSVFVPSANSYACLSHDLDAKALVLVRSHYWQSRENLIRYVRVLHSYAFV